MSFSSVETVRLHADDTVVVACAEIAAGAELGAESVTARECIPAGHKIAVAAMESGAPVRKYNQIIGFATKAIAPGDHVHTHNVAVRQFERDYAIGTELRPTETASDSATFDGIVPATVSRYVADAFRGDGLTEYPNVDGIVAITHGTGCGMGGGTGYDILRRTLAGYARHPNFGAIIAIGLGCEVMQLQSLMREENLAEGPKLHLVTIQDSGGTRKAIEAGVAFVKDLLPTVNDMKREAVPASEIILGLECGGSDAYSGLTANPGLGAAADMLVSQGGTAILGETSEIYGAEHLLTRRAASQEVGEKLIERIRWWEDYTARHGQEIDNNPSPGNKAGGLTTILEKSLGAVAKGGTTNLVEVVDYAQRPTNRGFVFMDTPGFDPVSVTGMVAGGANVVCFTTGRGSAFGCKPVPCLKLASNTAMYARMEEDMDLNCGVLLDGEVSMDDLGKQIFDLVLRTASGAPAKSEDLGYGDNEFLPWLIGATL
jgi:altronate hydrolase